jgi:hypothetical protein
VVGSQKITASLENAANRLCLRKIKEQHSFIYFSARTNKFIGRQFIFENL